VVSSPPESEETEAMGREIESRQGMYRVVAFKKVKRMYPAKSFFEFHQKVFLKYFGFIESILLESMN
jgi:hypothetical protein